VSSGSVTAEPPVRAAPPEAGRGGIRRYGVAFAFLAPAVFFLGVWIIYPLIDTVRRSFLYRDTNRWIGLHNYKEIFTLETIVTAIKNNAIWIGVVPALVTSIGLIFAVLTERIRWSVAFKTAVFMPMAISLFAAGVIWRVMDQEDPQLGALNAGIGVIHDAFSPAGPLPDAAPSVTKLTGSPKRGFTLQTPLHPGATAELGLTGISPDDVPSGAVQAVAPTAATNGIAGVVWRDFKPGGGTPGKVESGELGLPGVTVELKDSAGKKVGSVTSENNGTFKFDDVKPGAYNVAIGPKTFAKPFGGVAWLGPRLITPALIIAYTWVWAGFAMVVIAAGLAAIPRDVLEAARTDGGTEWQVFRRVTVPLLAPVLSVVFITMLINVLKVFDIVLSVAPGSSQDDANVIALAMWRTSFGGVNDYGLGAAIAVFLFLLVIPVLALNIRRFRREV
jgi:alpha-glucoside transport system permease protein